MEGLGRLCCFTLVLANFNSLHAHFLPPFYTSVVLKKTILTDDVRQAEKTYVFIEIDNFVLKLISERDLSLT